ncbi:RiPP maturation radical SAM C-methyltransferase [Enhygromyxa salina]|nr:RiPP maturation radical SAM C-methyltransferase [Enhygromyxa salina]
MRRDHALCVGLVSLPFASAVRPSLQLGLLQALGRAGGHRIDSHHLYLSLAQTMGLGLYEELCQHRGHMTGDWLFSLAAFGGLSTGGLSTRHYLEHFPSEVDWIESKDLSSSFLATLRQERLPRFIEDCLGRIDWGSYDVVGFTSTFQQNVASLALARAIKRAHPQVCILFGGSNLDGDMGKEVVRSFPWVDYVISGEADEAFPAFLDALSQGETRPTLDGLLVRSDDGSVGGTRSRPLTEMDGLPVPDFADYFDQASELGLLGEIAPKLSLPFESSRGCWWGAKHHCTFCGLNGSGMGYRSKSPERVLDELGTQADRHGVTSFEAVDNILNMTYFDDFFGEIENRGLDYEFFYEIKSNLTRAKIEKLARGGVRTVQPGIESLSTDILRLMRKGCTMLQNVLCLKWCSHYGIGVSWNLLFGFPGEREDHYHEQHQVLEKISHLQPPVSCNRIWLERFSPYYFRSDEWGIEQLQPSRSYRYVYPDHVDVEAIAYFFDYIMPNTLPAQFHATTQRLVEGWNEAWKSGDHDTMTYRRISDALLIDVRRDGVSRSRMLRGPLAQTYLYCGEAIRSIRKVRHHLEAVTGSMYSDETVGELLEGFCEAGLMVGELGRYLSLALPSRRGC